ncbi:hypothetical protein D9758_000764 [Tetrapyrgos nigripes]|uniref:Uncharacterized protein n=1 Tax=Tetrapyrgos nigripes TaxID=182062 RepID=A0A8H5GZ18_9AGAR|nr:hypothetical protein D9758_000764 [Tetrapyrgos nigripes]
MTSDKSHLIVRKTSRQGPGMERIEDEDLLTASRGMLRTTEFAKLRPSRRTPMQHKDFIDYTDIIQQLRNSYLRSALLSLITFPFALSSFHWLNSKATYGAIDLPEIPGQVEVTNLVLYKYVNPAVLSSSFAESIRFTITMLICLCISLLAGLSALSQTIWLSKEFHLARLSNRGDFGDKLRWRRLSIPVYRFLQILAALLLAGSACNALLDFFEF